MAVKFDLVGADIHSMEKHTILKTEGDRDRRRGLISMAMVLGVLLSGVMVLTTSRAAFSAQTQNTGNSISVGDVALTDDDNGSAMFSVTNMAPGDTAQACIEVTYEGTIADPSAVKLYSGGFTDSDALADELDITVEVGTGGSFAGCTGFAASSTIFATNTLTNFDATHSNYTNGVVGWDPATTPESRTFRFTIALPSDAANTVQGHSVTALIFTWEVQS
jgi:hypothetical protein